MSAAAPNVASMLKMGAVAFELAKQGYKVFPLRPGRKLPLRKGWQADASADVFKADEWPGDQYAPGILTGDIVVFDVEQEGLATDPIALGLDKIRTRTHRSARGGKHWLFRAPAGMSFACSSKKVAPLTDIRATGGLIVGPGGYAIDSKTGVTGWYSVEDAAPIIELPQHLVEKLKAAPQKADNAGKAICDLDTPWSLKRAREYLASDGPAPHEGPGRKVVPGGRGAAAFKAAARLGDFGISCEVAFEMLQDWNARHCEPAQDDDELAKCVEHSFEYRQDPVGRDYPLKHFDEVQTAPGTVPAAAPTTWRDHVTRAADLEHKQFQPVRFVLQGIVPEGLSMLAGRPKLGKSWLGLDMCLAIATGGECLGVRADVGDVLYLALEDNHRRLQRRMRRLKLSSWPARLNLATQWRRLDQGGVTDIAEWANSVPKPSLVIIDTFAAVKPITKSKGYEEDYAALAPLHRLAGDRGLGIMVLHHQRKQGADDPLDSISGTLGLAGCIDTPIVLARGPKGTTLYVRGRDVEEAEHGLEFDKATCRWRILGPAADVQRSRERQVVLGALRASAEPVRVATLAEMTGMQRSNLEVLLSKMAQGGEITRAGRGLYTVATAPI